MTIQENVYVVVAKIPKGKVATYGMVAKLAGLKSPRTVGTALHRNPTPETVPCHRVVNREGRLATHFAFGGELGQKKKLVSEGVQVINGKVDLTKYLWHP